MSALAFHSTVQSRLQNKKQQCSLNLILKVFFFFVKISGHIYINLILLPGLS